MVDENSVVGVAARTAPPLFVSGASMLGVPWQQWVFILTALYTFLQTIRLLPKMYSCVLCFSREWKCKKVCTQGK